ncbi:hypothetical protein ZIOFF_011913 [Zingiber officinale]|uniref:MULE transposase domain-containing protein n=1 Tax=Zingiber officinale TaxID=94328 RepID=A0A8J5LQE3_ZINOF|nr:hypothetical protein ZIOFF_011913 [Zingiber officinale]
MNNKYHTETNQKPPNLQEKTKATTGRSKDINGKRFAAYSSSRIPQNVSPTLPNPYLHKGMHLPFPSSCRCREPSPKQYRASGKWSKVSATGRDVLGEIVDVEPTPGRNDGELGSKAAETGRKKRSGDSNGGNRGSSNGSDELNYVPSLIFEPRIQITTSSNINMGPPLPSQDFVELPHGESPMYDTMIPFPLPPEVQLADVAQSSEYFHSQSSEDDRDILSIPMDDDSPDDGDCDTHLNRGEIPPYNERVMHFMNDIGEENDDDIVDREDNVHIDIWSESKNQIRLGMLLDSKYQLRKAVTLWSIIQNREFKVVESRINTWVAKYKVVSSDIDSNSGSENYSGIVTQVALKNVKVFKYIFWAFGQAIDAFHMCRPVISVDGTHLRGAYKRKMLIVVSKDANNCILPIAYAIVDEETIDSWSWFFEQLRGDNAIDLVDEVHTTETYMT